MSKQAKLVVDDDAPDHEVPGAGALRAQLQVAQQEIQRIHADESPERIETSVRLASLQVKVWDIKSQLSLDINEQLACAKQSAQWSEQVIRAQKSTQVDVLRDLFAKAEQMERHSSALKDLK